MLTFQNVCITFTQAVKVWRYKTSDMSGFQLLKHNKIELHYKTCSHA